MTRRLRPVLAAAALLGSALLLSACQGSPTTSIRWRESWELLVATRDGGMVDARIVVGNTGLLRGQAHLRADRWMQREAPILFGRDVAPVEVSVDPYRTAVRLGSDGLQRGENLASPETWTFRSRDEQANVLLHLTPEDGLAPQPVAWQEGGGQWTLDAPVARGRVEGWFSAGERGGLVEGMGVLLHRGGDGDPALPRHTLVIASRDVSIVLDIQGQGYLAAGWLGGEAVSLGRPYWELPERGQGTVRFEDGPTVELRRQRRLRGARLPYDHLLPVEQRLLAWAGQWRERRVQHAQARVSWRGQSWQAAAIVLDVVPAEWTPPLSIDADDGQDGTEGFGLEGTPFGPGRAPSVAP